MTNTFKSIFTITNRITAGLTRIERARGFLEAATLSEAWVREMGHRALIFSTDLRECLRHIHDEICDIHRMFPLANYRN